MLLDTFFYAISKAADPNDADTLLEPITNDENKEMIEAYRNVMSPNRAIFGCVA